MIENELTWEDIWDQKHSDSTIDQFSREEAKLKLWLHNNAQFSHHVAND